MGSFILTFEQVLLIFAMSLFLPLLIFLLFFLLSYTFLALFELLVLDVHVEFMAYFIETIPKSFCFDFSFGVVIASYLPFLHFFKTGHF